MRVLCLIKIISCRYGFFSLVRTFDILKPSRWSSMRLNNVLHPTNNVIKVVPKFDIAVSINDASAIIVPAIGHCLCRNNDTIVQTPLDYERFN
jgi:hypothetical protein